MIVQIQRAIRRSWRQLGDLLGRLVRRLQGVGVSSKNSASSDALASAARAALRPVVPSSGFREALRSNLSFAVRQKMVGLSVECPKPFRQRIILGLSAGLLAAAMATLLLVLRSRPSHSEG